MVKRYKNLMIEEDLHKRIKGNAFNQGKTINKLIREFVEEKYPDPLCDTKNKDFKIKKNNDKNNSWWKI